MTALKKRLLVNTLTAFAMSAVLGLALFHFSKDQTLTLTAAGMLWFVLQLTLTIKSLEHHAGPDENRFKH
jgi:hypothetical protein